MLDQQIFKKIKPSTNFQATVKQNCKITSLTLKKLISWNKFTYMLEDFLLCEIMLCKVIYLWWKFLERNFQFNICYYVCHGFFQTTKCLDVQRIKMPSITDFCWLISLLCWKCYEFVNNFNRIEEVFNYTSFKEFGDKLLWEKRRS